LGDTIAGLEISGIVLAEPNPDWPKPMKGVRAVPISAQRKNWNFMSKLELYVVMLSPK
jgi:hypothetical protein